MSTTLGKIIGKSAAEEYDAEDYDDDDVVTDLKSNTLE